jgi:CRP/FNR family cyclic AMP-dependent transcriptional regulator
MGEVLLEQDTCANVIQTLDPDIQSALFEIMREVSFSAGDQIFAQDDPASKFFVVVSGRVKVMRVTSDGHEMILCMITSGGCFCPLAVMDEGSQLGMAQAATDVTLLCAQATDFRAFYQNNLQLADKMMKTCLHDMRRLVGRLESLTFESLKMRLARILLEKSVSVPIDHTTRDEIHLTQQEIAQLIGVSRESVSHLLAVWERENALVLKRGRVIISHRDILEQLALGKLPPF